MADLVTALSAGRVLLMDGAMGTELQRAGIAPQEGYEACNLTRPDAVVGVHRAYVDAGAELLLTNTFQVNAGTLGHDEKYRTALIAAGVAHARSALGETGWVLADFGPTADLDYERFARIVWACRKADGVLLETFSDLEQVTALARASRTGSGSKMPLLISFTFDSQTLKTFAGASPESCAQGAAGLGVAALGVNCGRELELAACAEILRRYRTITPMPLFVRPNAGTPTADRHYPRDSEEMARGLTSVLKTGAVMVGGCCGTTPRHIRAFRRIVDEWNAGL